jgi:hypothetical protein
MTRRISLLALCALAALVLAASGPESSDTPAPTIETVSSLGGDGTSTPAIVGVALGGLALLVALAGMLVRGGRPLT